MSAKLGAFLADVFVDALNVVLYAAEVVAEKMGVLR